jgi:hypothetical protein
MSEPMRSEESNLPPESGSGPRYDACMTGLRQWRDGMVHRRELPFNELKDTHLRSAIVHGRRDPKRTAAVLPTAYAHLAPVIVAAINDADPVGAVPAAPAAPAAPTAAVPNPTPPSPPHSNAPSTPQAPRPAPPQTTSPATAHEADLQQRAEAFATLDFSEELGDPGPLRVAVGSGQVSLAWDPSPERPSGTFYRVVAKDDEPPYDPSYARLIDITSELTATDAHAFESGVRYYQVWRNSGETPAEAMAHQPRLHAEAAIVAPIQHLNLREDGGRVIGQWTTLSGITRVHVHRIPVERAAQAGHDPQYRLDAGEANLDGFIDREVTRGRTYLYRFYAEGTVNGIARLSVAVGKTLSVSALLTPVNDLQARGHGTEDDLQFDLTWTPPPAGRVVIFRTQAPPSAGLEAEVREESALASAGLPPELRLAHPTQRHADGTMGMREVPSPAGWDRVYFTPVTIIEGKARVGRSVSQAVIPIPDDPVIVERTQHQILKFGWPGKAAAVAVAIGPAGAPATTPQEGSGYLEVTRANYERLGGLQFPQALPAHGCSVHLAGVAFVNRLRIYGDPTVTEYPGLLRLRYFVEYKRSILHNPDRVLVRLAAEVELGNCPPFVLVHNPDRLPLHPRDGEVLQVMLNLDEVTQPGFQFRPPRLAPQFEETAWRASVRGRHGFVRLFADLPPDRLRLVALLDPALSSLRLPA